MAQSVQLCSLNMSGNSINSSLLNFTAIIGCHFKPCNDLLEIIKNLTIYLEREYWIFRTVIKANTFYLTQLRLRLRNIKVTPYYSFLQLWVPEWQVDMFCNILKSLKGEVEKESASKWTIEGDVFQRSVLWMVTYKCYGEPLPKSHSLKWIHVHGDSFPSTHIQLHILVLLQDTEFTHSCEAALFEQSLVKAIYWVNTMQWSSCVINCESVQTEYHKK